MSDDADRVCGFLRQIELFAGLDSERMRWLAERGEVMELTDGEVFVRVGDAATHFHILAEGTVDWLVPIDGTLTHANRMHAPTYTGMATCLTGESLNVEGRAHGPTTLLRYDEATLLELVQADLEVLREVVRQIRPIAAMNEELLQRRERLAALGSLSAGLAHEINNPAAAARRAADELARSVDVLRGGANRLAGLTPEQLAALGQLACTAAKAPAGDDPLEAADREDALADWLEDRGVPDAWAIAGELAGAGLDEAWAARIEAAAGPEHLARVLPWAAAGATTGGLVGELGESLRRVSELVGAIKAYSYMDQAPEQELDVHEGLESTLTMLGHKLKKTGVRVTREFDAALPRITASGGELNQVWTNLLDNAIGAAKPDGHVRVATGRENGQIRVTIADDGPGIPEDVRDRIFEPFFTTKAVGEGTGLGLDVVWRIVVTGMHGEIRVRSEPGDTRFDVLLPVAG